MSESLSVAWTRVDVVRRRSVEETVGNCIILEYYRCIRQRMVVRKFTENVEGNLQGRPDIPP
jgi:hypothetical protein